MTLALAAKVWLGFLISAFVVWLVLELGAILWAKLTGQKNILDWTLSDTIRRWSAAHRWLAPVTIGVMAMLAYHFFIQQNLPVSLRI